MLGVTMEESGVSKVIALRLDEDIKVGKLEEEVEQPFVEEDVEPEQGIYIPPRPPKRVHTQAQKTENENLSAQATQPDTQSQPSPAPEKTDEISEINEEGKN